DQRHGAGRARDRARHCGRRRDHRRAEHCATPAAAPPGATPPGGRPRRPPRAHRRGPPPRWVAGVVLEASPEVRGPIVYATLIIVVAMVPVFFLQGLTGAFFHPLVFLFVLAVGVAA